MRICKSCPHAIPDADMGAYECGVDHGLRYGYQGCDEDPPEDIDVDTMIESLPSAQPDVPDTNVGDLISRQAAIRWVKTECNPYGKPTLEFESGKKVIEHLEQMPSAQSEPLTDKEQRIFLAAMSREEHDHAERIKGYFFGAGLREDER